MTKSAERLTILLNNYLKTLETMIDNLKNFELYEGDIDNLPNIYDTIAGSEYILKKLVQFNKPIGEKKEKLNFLIIEFNNKYANNKISYELHMHWYLNNLRTKYDNQIESYIFESEEELAPRSDSIDFDDFFLSIRDKIEFIKLGIKELGHDKDFKWFTRFEKNLERSDADLKEHINKISEYYIIKKNIRFNLPNYIPESFWWRKTIHDLTQVQIKC